MALSRRNVLIGLGGLVAGGGALVGTGAFTTVQAERTVNVETAGDASGFLGLVPTNDTGDDVIPDADEYDNGAYAQVTNGTVQIVLDGQNVPGDGLNQNAVTTIDNIVYVVNNGTQPVTSLTFNLDVGGLSTSANSDHEDALSITSGSATIPADGSTNILTQSDVHGAASGTPGGSDLNAGEKVPFGLEVDLLNSGITDFDSNANVTLTINAGT